MTQNDSVRLRELEFILLLSFLALFSFSLLYIFRIYDNNTLTSWQWSFTHVGIKKILLFLAAAIIFSLLISWQLSIEDTPVPVLVISATMAVLPLWSEPELLLDSGRYFVQAKSLSQHGIFYFAREWGREITAWTDMPLTPFLYGLIFKIAGESRIAVQFFNTLVFILTVLITFRIGAILWNRETGFYAGFLLLGMPYLLTQVPLMLVDVHTMFFLVLALYCFLTALRLGGFIRICLAAVTVAMAFMVKYSTWPMLAILPLCGFIFLKNGHEIFLKRATTIFMLAALPVLVIFIYRYPVVTEQVKILLSYQRPALKLWHENFTSTFLFQIHPFITLLALFGGYMAYQAREKRFFIPLFYILLIFILQIQRIRYTLPLFPFITLMAAYGLTAFKEERVKRYAACLIVSTSLIIVFAGYLPFFKTTSMMNIKMAGDFLNTLDVDTVEVFTLPQDKSEGSTIIVVPQLDLFTSKNISSRQNWSSRNGENPPPLSPLLSTWKLNKPSYYQSDTQRSPLVIVSGSPIDNGAYHKIRGVSPSDRVQHFTLHSGVFRYKTFVSVYY